MNAVATDSKRSTTLIFPSHFDLVTHSIYLELKLTYEGVKMSVYLLWDALCNIKCRLPELIPYRIWLCLFCFLAFRHKSDPRNGLGSHVSHGSLRVFSLVQPNPIVLLDDKGHLCKVRNHDIRHGKPDVKVHFLFRQSASLPTILIICSTWTGERRMHNAYAMTISSVSDAYSRLFTWADHPHVMWSPSALSH